MYVNKHTELTQRGIVLQKIDVLLMYIRLKDLPLSEVGGNGSNEALNVKTELIGRAQSQPKHDGNEREEGVQSCVLSYQNLQTEDTKYKTDTHTQRKLYNPEYSPIKTWRDRRH